MDWPHVVSILTIIGIIVTAVTNIEKITGWLANAWSWIWGKRAPTGGYQPAVPQRTVTVIPDPRINALSWSPASLGEKPMLQVVGDFNVTNTWSKDAHLPAAAIRFRSLGLRRRTYRGECLVQHVRTAYSGAYPIPPNHLAHVRVHFMIPIRKKRRPGHFKADVAVIDQFNNYHWVRGAEFKDTKKLF